MKSTIVVLKLLLEFFARPQGEQMRETPDLLEPVQIRVDDFAFVTRLPRRILAALVVSLLRECRLAVPSRGEVLEEIQVIFYPWMMESTRLEVFRAKPQPEEADVIWRTVSRLSKLALEAPELSELVTQGMTVRQLIADHSRAVDAREWARFPIESGS